MTTALKEANPTSRLNLGDLQDTANTFGAYRHTRTDGTSNTYDGRQIELALKFRF